jgi:hypothetical protein
VLPALLAAEPALRTTLARTMRILADEDELLATMATAFARDFAAEQHHPGEVALDRAMMATLSRAMQRRTVRAALDEAFPEASRLESAHIEAIVDGLADDAFARDLACGLRAFSEYGKIVISHRGERSRAWHLLCSHYRAVSTSVRSVPSRLHRPTRERLPENASAW